MSFSSEVELDCGRVSFFEDRLEILKTGEATPRVFHVGQACELEMAPFRDGVMEAMIREDAEWLTHPVVMDWIQGQQWSLYQARRIGVPTATIAQGLHRIAEALIAGAQMGVNAGWSEINAALEAERIRKRCEEFFEYWWSIRRLPTEQKRRQAYVQRAGVGKEAAVWFTHFERFCRRTRKKGDALSHAVHAYLQAHYEPLQPKDGQEDATEAAAFSASTRVRLARGRKQVREHRIDDIATHRKFRD